MIGWAASKAISQIVGFIYPAYQSYKALQTESDDDDTQWLTYWVVFSFFITFEHVFEFLVSWIPFYYELKVAIQLWLTFTNKGSKILYEAYVRDVYLKVAEKINAQLSTTTSQTTPKPEIQNIYPSVTQTTTDTKKFEPLYEDLTKVKKE